MKFDEEYRLVVFWLRYRKANDSGEFSEILNLAALY
jgi:hypothetical protein